MSTTGVIAQGGDGGVTFSSGRRWSVWAPSPLLLFGLTILFLLVFAVLGWPALAQGGGTAGTADPSPSPTLVFPTDQVWTFVAANLVTLPTYALNKYAPWVGETAKGVVLMVTSAVAAGITQAVTMGEVGFNVVTLQVVGLAVLSSFMVHRYVWQPTEIAAKFGAGQNRPGQG